MNDAYEQFGITLPGRTNQDQQLIDDLFARCRARDEEINRLKARVERLEENLSTGIR